MISPLSTADRLREAYLLDQSRPTVRMNFVSSLDGAATVHGRSGGLGNPEDRELLDVLRSLADVVVIGAGTVRAEGYGGAQLSEESLAWRRRENLAEQPPFAVVSANLDLDPMHPFFVDAVVRPFLITHAAADPERRAALAEVADVMICGERRVEPAGMVAAFVKRGFRQILCEGGPRLFGSFIDADCVDELCLSLSPLLVAGSGSRISRSGQENTRSMALVHSIQSETGMLFLRYRRSR